MRTLRGCLILGTMVLLFTLTGTAQFEKGRNYVGAHLGLSGVGSAVTLGGDYEIGVSNRIGIGTIGVGALLDFWSYTFTYALYRGPAALGDFSYRYTSIAAMGNYHFILDDRKWDPFAGLVLGYYIVSARTPLGSWSGLEASRLYLGLQIGARYQFSPSWTAQARLGFGPYILAIGADFRF